MTCPEAHQNFSLYLYGELDFTIEEALEQHLIECSSCTAALGAERRWHEAAGTEQVPVPLDFLSQCRQELRESLGVMRDSKDPLWIRCLDSLGFRSNAWSMRIAMASLLVCLGFGMSRLLERHGLPGPNIADGFSSEMSVFDPSRAHVRLIEPGRDDRVQLVVDEVREHVITGSPDDYGIRQLLLAAVKDPTDPAIRVDSVDVLKNSDGDDIRDALLDSVEHDPNAGVRMKALEALGRFSNDTTTRRTLLSVLSHDESPDVRTQAIDLLMPPQGDHSLSPQLTDVLENMVRSDPDEYIRMRCRQALHSPRIPVHVY
jgi:hypothetical protein